ncbi:hypothetical protein F441_01077 [Phytophthora nicotianae CJ01A1]|uniref:Uncharacterized protein n=4 Tax=Phytophthora nicotianae TaxID=4792 RepID=V9FY07_PHYNI|nr:hypothetical protein F443_01103 [Phytophthora nicotianae P1569]ETO85083.1 hypothetical protein F444_01110 [Phytophthora nicotianae P1976]ETP26135.1 hypothetical protein F441_01077 [Phytophthora nicotianae CJ01A1]ETP54132.1 hypothetical protein F442_01052 [Phytophthora nicotianae P10297]
MRKHKSSISDPALKQKPTRRPNDIQNARSFAAQDSSTARVSFSALPGRPHPQQAA